ncbi:hypothetical protein EB796_013091 [Bugula neritina]|uniref:Uncharacterized protein n=1 Tax=Bugula neritina TaxID=10212 RepID=A0A7J7JRL5_BUGNE|nr:hypothetical protein EB796_013091 [Bugula neritina]
MEVKGQARRAVTGVVTILSSQYERLAPICYIWCILVTPNTAGACVTCNQSSTKQQYLPSEQGEAEALTARTKATANTIAATFIFVL